MLSEKEGDFGNKVHERRTKKGDILRFGPHAYPTYEVPTDNSSPDPASTMIVRERAHRRWPIARMKAHLKKLLYHIVSERGDQLVGDVLHMLPKVFCWGDDHPIQTAAIRFVKVQRRTRTCLVINADHFFGDMTTRGEQIATLYHEALHVILRHVDQRHHGAHRHKFWNIAQDLAINSIIAEYNRSGDGTYNADLRMFPATWSAPMSEKEKEKLLIQIANKSRVDALLAKHGVSSADELDKDVIEAAIAEWSAAGSPVTDELRERFADCDARLAGDVLPLVGQFHDYPPGLSAEEYFALLRRDTKTIKMNMEQLAESLQQEHNWFGEADGGSGEHKFLEVQLDAGDGSGGSIMAPATEDIQEALAELYSEVKRSVDRHLAAGQGSSAIDQILRDLYTPRVPWESILSQFLARCFGGTKKDFARPHRRGIMDLPGTRRKMKHRVWIFVDQSGSMSDKDVAQMYSRLRNLMKSAEVRIWHFDWEVDTDTGYVVKRRSDLQPMRTKSGGTSFDSVWAYVDNADKRYPPDALIIMTDLGASPPSPARRNAIFVYSDDMTYTGDETGFRMQGHKVLCLPGGED